jgi:phenylacetate-CoA ligase
VNSEDIYRYLPAPLQNAVCSAHGWRVNRSRFGREFWNFLNAAEERLGWPADRLHAFRDDELRRFVRHCHDTVPYYRRLLSALGVAPASITTLDDLKRLPILTKAAVQEAQDEFLSTAVPAGQRVMAHTSGTTGGGLRFVTTLRAVQQQWAVWWRYRRLHGLPFGTWCGYFGGRSVVSVSQTRPPFWRINHPGRQILFSGYHIAPNTAPHYVRELTRRAPPWLHGYPSLLALMAQSILESGVDLGYRPRWITVGAENLLPQQAKAIEAAFGVRPLEHYGMAEAVANCFQCRRGRLHVDEDFAATEFVPVGDGSFRIVGSNITNLAMPFLRYDTGDVARLDPGGCDCGLSGRIVSSVDGRQEDYILLRNGVRLGRLDHIFKDLVRIREAQIHQHTPGIISVRVVRAPAYSKDDEKQLLAEFHKRVGDQAEVRIEYREALERTKAGKLRFVISEIEEGKLDSPVSSGPRVNGRN